MVLVVLLHKPPEHTFIVYCYLWQVVSVKEKEFPVTVDNDRLCSFSVFQHTPQRFIYGYSSRFPAGVLSEVLTSKHKQIAAFQRCLYICKHIFRLFSGFLLSVRYGFCYLIFSLTFSSFSFHDGKSLDMLTSITFKEKTHHITSKVSMIFSNCFRLICIRLPFIITQPAVGFSSASLRSLFSPIRKYSDTSSIASVYFSQIGTSALIVAGF